MKITYSYSSAIISECGRYRHALIRTWRSRKAGAPLKNYALWVMLNPSTANGSQDDPTVRRCVGYSFGWGYDGLVICNLWDWRSTDYRQLRMQMERHAHDFNVGVHEQHPHPLSFVNDRYIKRYARGASLIMAAWGAHIADIPESSMRVAAVERLLVKRGDVYQLGVTKNGDPVHPLMQAADLQPQLRWSKL